MARLIDLPPEYVAGGRYLAAAPSRKEQFYKQPGLINMEAIERIMTMAEKIGKSPLTGLAIKGIAKLFQMGEPTLADLQSQEAKLREALAAEGRGADEIEAEIQHLRNAQEELKASTLVAEGEVAADIAAFQAPGTTPEAALRQIAGQLRRGEINEDRLSMEGWTADEIRQIQTLAGYADPASVRRRMTEDVGPEHAYSYMERTPAHPRYETTPLPTIKRADPESVRDRMEGPYEPFTPAPTGVEAIPEVEPKAPGTRLPRGMPLPEEVEEARKRIKERGAGSPGDVWEDSRITELRKEQASVEGRLRAFEAEKQRIAEAQKAKQAQIARVQAQIKEIPTFRGQQIQSMDDVIRMAPTADRKERGALLVAARNQALPSNLFDFNYQEDAMKKVSELFPTALERRREGLTAVELRKVQATEKKAEAAMIRAMRVDLLAGLKKEKLQSQIDLLNQKIALDPQRKAKLEAQIAKLRASTKASGEMAALRRAALAVKQERMNLTRLKALKQPIERLYKNKIDGLTDMMKVAYKAKVQARRDMTIPSAASMAGLDRGAESKYLVDAELAKVQHDASKAEFEDLQTQRLELQKEANKLGAANTIREYEEFLKEYGTP